MPQEPEHILAEALRRDFSAADLSADAPVAGRMPVPVAIIDCVLSLRRPYKKVVRPRVERFMKLFPHITTTRALCDLICSYPSLEAFGDDALRFKSVSRAKIILAVAEHFLTLQQTLPGDTEPDKMRGWATRVTAHDQKAFGVKGVGLAAYQYLRMHLGADTTKPDLHIVGYISDALGRRVRAIDAVAILEDAARAMGVRAIAVDRAIWTKRSHQAARERCAVRPVNDSHR